MNVYITYDSNNETWNIMSENGCVFYSKNREDIRTWLETNKWKQVTPLEYVENE